MEDRSIAALEDCRAATLSERRRLIKLADPEVKQEIMWRHRQGKAAILIS